MIHTLLHVYSSKDPYPQRLTIRCRIAKFAIRCFHTSLIVTPAMTQKPTVFKEPLMVFNDIQSVVAL